MIKISEFKKIINELRSIYLATNKRTLFNARESNNIQSEDASLESIKGQNITILKGAYICQNSAIQSYSYVGFNTLISKAKIGRYVSIANNVNIGHGEHPLDQISTNSLFIKNAYEVLTQKDCVIEHDVWIGSGATIRRGITLGIGSVVGANAFVNKDVPPFAIVVGVPAKIISYRFPEEKITRILGSKWWERNLDEAKLIIEQLEKKD